MNHSIHNEHLTVTAAERGAELQSILAADGTEYLWQGDPRYWNGRALNIFPYVARLTEGRCSLDGETYQMDIHGIAPYRDFRLTEQSEDRMVLELVSDEETLRSYPRRFAFRVIYALQGGVLTVTYEVENRDARTMYFGLGGHPGFRVPLAEGASFEDYRLRFSRPCQPKRIGFTAACFLDGTATPFALENDRDLPLRHDLFDQDAIVLRDADHTVTLETDGDSRGVTVTFPGMDYLGVWHKPRTDAPYVCLEPWCSLPATQDVATVLEEQPDLIRLEAGGTYRNQWTIQLHPYAKRPD